MSHEIMGQRFLSRVAPAWHKLGKIFEKDKRILASEAVGQVAGDVNVQTFPISYQYNQVNADGSVSVITREVADQQVVVRMPTKDSPQPEEFGVVGNKWKPVSYVQMSKALDKLSETYQVETCGLLQQGALCFIGLKGGNWDVIGDPMESYFIVNLSLKPGEGHKVFHTPVRVVCWNTNTAAQESATISLSIPHSLTAEQQLGIAGDLVARFAKAMDDTKATCESFAKRTLTIEEAERIFNAAFPEPVLPKNIATIRKALGGQEQVELFKRTLDPNALAMLMAAEDRFEDLMKRSQELRQVARERYELFKPAKLSGTAWAAYNTVTEIADWREGRGAELGSLVGSRAREKGRAFTETLAVVKGEESPFEQLLARN